MESSEEMYHKGLMKFKKPVPSLPEGKYIDVTCGVLRARLHRELFICPGIRRECIELENGEFVTPKRFMFMGEKARLKDWKNAVRIKGVQVRKYIDAGELTFWNHETTCTGRCQARTPANKYGSVFSHSPTQFVTKSDLITASTENGVMQIHNVQGGENVEWDSNGYEDPDEHSDIKPDIEQLQIQMLGNVSQAQKQIQSTLANAVSKQMCRPPMSTSVVTYPEASGETTDEEDRVLWKGIVELGLVDEFFREIKASLDLLKNNMVRRMVPLEDTMKISVIVKQLGLMSKLKYKLEAHQTDMERQRMRLDKEMEELQRKVKEYELKKEMLKRKSDCFNQLLDMASKEPESLPESKRLCSNGPSQIVFPTSMPLRNSSVEKSTSAHLTEEVDTLRADPTESLFPTRNPITEQSHKQVESPKPNHTESRRKQKTTEKVMVNTAREERDSVELEYINGNSYDMDYNEMDDEVNDPSYVQSSCNNQITKANGEDDNHTGPINTEAGQGDANANAAASSDQVPRSGPLTRIRKGSRSRKSLSDRD